MTNPNAPVRIAPASGRRFRLLDAMILVASISTGLALGRVAFSNSYPRFKIPPEFWLYCAIDSGHAAAYPMILSLSVAFLLLRLMPPRPSLRQIMTQPSVVACGTAIAVLGLFGVSLLIDGRTTSFHSLAFLLSPATGMFVAFHWAGLWLYGMWQPEKDWVDRLGRVLGVCWLFMLLLLACMFLV